ncbi:MAG: heme-binding protein, partial [Planctomycetaceae bacterium]
MRILLFVSALFIAVVFPDAVSPVSAQVKMQLPEVMESVVQANGQPPAAVAPKAKPAAIDVSGGPDPIWIWAKHSSTPQKCWLRRKFENDAESGALIATCDNGMQVYLNGKRVLSSTEWQSPVKADVTKHLRQGLNEIRIDATNEGSLAGFAMKLVMRNSAAESSYLISDKSWEASLSKDFSSIVDTTTHGKMGVAPWGNVFSKPAGSDLVSSVPRNVFQVLPGFQVEKLYDVDKGEEGSWVCMTFDNQGRIIASDQGGKALFRITPPAVDGTQSTPTKVEKLDISISSAQGMLYAFDALYCSCNGGPGSGLYRLTDTDGDDQFDKMDKLKSFQGGGEHGPHALRLSPDGKSIYVIAGNHTNPPEKFDSSRVPSNWGEDLLLPRQWDARGHARGKLAPGGWIAKTDPAGKTWEIVSIGYRNPYDMDFNEQGELFAYDADMEWDMGSPWYRPTRICHVISGSEFGWRSGTGKWPTYYVDSLPQVVDIGPGSPVGVAFGTGAKFPPKYQRALYCCDWTFGTMYAVHLQPSGSSFVGEREEFLSRTPLPLTDVEIGPDGAMYFTMGGRGTQSGLFRVTYTGTVAPTAADGNTVAARLRELRHSLEEQHHPGRSAADVARLWPYLRHTDRHIRYAARVALEHAEPQLWEDRVLAETDPQTLITASVALARQGRRESQRAITEKLAGIDFSELSEPQQLDLVRALSLVFIRLGGPDAATAAALAKTFDTQYPARSPALNRELVQLLVYLNSSKVIDRTLKLLAAEDGDSAYDWTEVLARNGGYGGTIAKMLANMPDLDKAHYAFALRNMKYGWTLGQRKAYLAYYQQA